MVGGGTKKLCQQMDPQYDRSHSKNWEVIWQLVSKCAKKKARTIGDIGTLRNKIYGYFR